ncbi:MAG: TIGR02710 family CRISPR-associated CARF protein [Candidatus Binatia bacterium]
MAGDVALTRALIVSLGGTKEPVVKAITEHRAELVCFLVSQESLRNVGPVLEGAKSSWEPRRAYTVVADEAEDLVHCYEKALQAAAWVEQQGISPEAVVVDYTGGTKAMTAALTLATVGKGYRFSYIGGKERTKEGLGVVVDGTEMVRAGLDPWRLFAVEEERRFVIAFNTYQFEAALSVLQTALNRETLPPKNRRRLEALKQTTEAYRAWDRFEHREATRLLSQAKRSLRAVAELTGDPGLGAFLSHVEDNFKFLQRLQDESKQFNVVCRAMVEDLVANAGRRAVEGKHDDAVARLYRATEMVAQVCFEERPLACRTDQVPFEKLPESLREEFLKRYLNPEKATLTLPLYAAFRVLQAIKAGEGEAFFSREAAFKGLLQARNASLLAHGATPVGPETYATFRTLVCEAFGLTDIPVFPSLEA